MKLSDKISQIFKESLTAPDPNWGDWIQVVDHQTMGKLAREFRIKKKVRAVDVGRLMDISKARIYFLEKGRTAWTLGSLKQYILAVARMVERKKKNEMSKVRAPAQAAKKAQSNRKGR